MVSVVIPKINAATKNPFASTRSCDSLTTGASQKIKNSSATLMPVNNIPMNLSTNFELLFWASIK